MLALGVEAHEQVLVLQPVFGGDLPFRLVRLIDGTLAFYEVLNSRTHNLGSTELSLGM